jgi:N-methylhydantoinase B
MNAAELEIIRTAFAFVPEEMGVALRRTAYSPNIKERMDASCAIFNEDGLLVAQAEHIPVHLGAMPIAVQSVLRDFPGTLRDGDQVILNDPYRGGTHLPDITLIRPVFFRSALLGFAVNRAHHADVGGTAPGSMPPDATRLDEEGVVLEPQKFLDRGRERDSVRRTIREGMRNPRERLGDLRAQVAANELGARRFGELASRYGVTILRSSEAELMDYSERRVRSAIQILPTGVWHAEDRLEGADGSLVPIRVEVTMGRSGVAADFEGTHRQMPGNLNAPLAVTQSACAYVLRCLTDPGAPPNAGAYRALRVTAPEGSLVNARSPAAVAAGNVETSQRIVDVLLLALAEPLADRIPAQSQGTMNNLLIGRSGRRAFAYYETIAGGEGALPYRDGMDGVHTHMTNTRNTPVEALELAYPLRVEEYRLLESSGGAGRHRGGDGIRRSVRLLEDRIAVSIISERRRIAPRGLDGGSDGRAGRNTLVRGRTIRELPAKVSFPGREDDLIVIDTPGGGGWGASDR